MKNKSEKVIDNLHQKQKVFFDTQATLPTAFRIKKLKAAANIPLPVRLYVTLKRRNKRRF